MVFLPKEYDPNLIMSKPTVFFVVLFCFFLVLGCFSEGHPTKYLTSTPQDFEDHQKKEGSLRNCHNQEKPQRDMMT